MINEVVHRIQGTVGLMIFPRDVTAQTRETAYNAYHELARAQITVMGLNFEASSYLNSAGIGLVISLVEDATLARRKVCVYGLSPHYCKLFTMVGLMDRVLLVADEAEIFKQFDSDD